jgi:hypothetical protein
MSANPEVLEREAHSFLAESRFEEAYRLFSRAARGYQEQRNHKQATLCFASAASCWNRKHGEKIFYNAANAYGQAAKEAEKYGDYEYASLLYKYAAINHERDVEFSNFSECFYRSKECYRRFLGYSLTNPNKIRTIAKTKEERGLKGIVKRFLLWLVVTFSFAVWGHGERPARTLGAGVAIIFISTFFYMLDYLCRGSVRFNPNFFEAFYFSVVTFTTLGYGDIVPLGFTKMVATFESFAGLFVMPLFVIGLSRKYLRI